MTEAFVGHAEPVPAEVRRQMTGRSWRPGCPVGLEELAYLRLSHWGYDGNVHWGALVVHKDLADEVVAIFGELFARHFPIEKMRLVDEYDGDDDQSMEDNNTSAFNCRTVPGHSVLSKHSYGRAIDINPRVNPYVTASSVRPPSGEPFLDRTQSAAGLISPTAVCYQPFIRRGWHWGGLWKHSKDYQHFEK